MRNFVPSFLLTLSLIAAAADSQPSAAKIPAEQWQQAERLAQAHQPREALTRFKQLLQGSADQNMMRTAANALRQSGALKEAEQLLVWASGRVKAHDPFAQELADLYLAQLRFPEAVHQMARALENGANASAAGITAIAVQAGYGTVAGLLQREPLRRDESLRLRGDLWLRAGDQQRAWESYRDVGDMLLAGALLNSLLQRDPPAEQAADFIRQHLKRKPKDSGQWELRLAGYRLSLGENDDAQRLLEGLAGRGVFPAQYELARFWMEQRHSPVESRRLVERYARAWPEPLRSDGQFLKAASLAALDRGDSALLALAPLADPGRAAATRQQAYFQMAEIEFARQNLDRAIELYDSVAKLGPGGDLVNDALSRLLLISGNKTDRMGQLKTWAAGRAAELRLDLTAAADTYRILAQSGSGGLADQARLRLAQLADQGRDYREAARQYQELGQSSPDTLLASEALYRAGKLKLQRLTDLQAARKIWEAAILKFPDTSWADLMRSELERSRPAPQH